MFEHYRWWVSLRVQSSEAWASSLGLQADDLRLPAFT